MDDCQIKIDRAEFHLHHLELAVLAHMAEHPPVTTLSPSNARGPNGELGFDLVTNVKAPPRKISAEIGDVIHNLRCALDLLAVGLVKAAGQNTRDVHFPFAHDANSLDDAAVRKRFSRAGPAAMEILRSLRPYKGGNVALRGLHDLDIQDKHHAIIPASASITSAAIAPEMVDGQVTMKLVEGSEPNVIYVFPDGPLGGEPLIPTLHHLVETVKGVVEAFSPVLAIEGKDDTAAA